MKIPRIILVVIVFSIFFSLLAADGIPKRIGHWRVEVGPAGNEFYELPIEKADVQPPTEEVMNVVRCIAPPNAKIEKWQLEKEDLYSIRAEVGPADYDFVITKDAKILELEYSNNSTGVSEEPGDLIIKGTKKPITSDKIPDKTLKIIKKIGAGEPRNAWIAKTVAGDRLVVLAGDLVFYARLDGQIQAVGLVDSGALNEIDPKDLVKKSPEEIYAEAQKELSKYQDKFNIQKNIKRLGNKPNSKDGSFRFVVMGDSRSNFDMWQSIIQHVNQLDPKPAFVINSGDIVRHGYTHEYLEYFIPPLLNTDIPYFIAIGNHDDGDSGKAIEYQALFGKNSLNYFFDYGQYRFIIVDNCTIVQPYKETLKWLEKTLASTPKNFKIIVVTHKPPYNISKWAYHSWDKEYSQQFTDLMSQYHVSHVFLGHIHAYSTATYNGVNYTVSGGGGAGLHNRYGPLGNVHHYVICDVLPDGTLKQQVVRFFKEDK